MRRSDNISKKQRRYVGACGTRHPKVSDIHIKSTLEHPTGPPSGKMRVHLPLLCRALATFSAIPALAVFAERSDSDSLIIKLNTGSFRGTRADNGTERWLGIPYAVPPLGKLRFKAPVPLPSAAGTVTINNASQFGNACPQPPFFTAIDAPISEDCLVLNVSIECSCFQRRCAKLQC